MANIKSIKALPNPYKGEAKKFKKLGILERFQVVSNDTRMNAFWQDNQLRQMKAMKILK